MGQIADRVQENSDRPVRRQNNPWQFSLARLMIFMTAVAIGLALFRTMPVVSLGLFVIGGSAALLHVSEYFSRIATGPMWTFLTMCAWLFAILIFTALIFAFIVIRASH